MDGNRPVTLSDEALDRELAAALGVSPSPEFLARVRAGIAAEPTPHGGRLLMPWALVPAAAVCALAVAIAVASLMDQTESAVSPAVAGPVETSTRGAAAPSGAPQQAVAGSPEARPAVPDLGSAGQPGEAAGAQEDVAEARRSVTRANDRSAASTGSTRPTAAAAAGADEAPFDDVLVPNDHQRAFERLVAAVEQGRGPAFVPPPDPDNPFGIEPIAIEPLTLTDLSIGQPAEVEDRP